MSMWEYMSQIEGYAKAHSSEDAAKLSEKEKDELWNFLNQ